MTTRLLPPRAAHALAFLCALAAALALAACSPTYNWRDYTSPDARYRVTFPAKPSSATRTIDLDGLQVSMTMTAAEVEGATFAVGAAEAPDAGRAPGRRLRADEVPEMAAETPCLTEAACFPVKRA